MFVVDGRDHLDRIARAALMSVTAGRLAALALAAGHPIPESPFGLDAPAPGQQDAGGQRAETISR